ncbi:glycosyltransferase family 4 protein [Phocaeicola sp.]|uniref:glycosyltransferase family 4 protein n=1 Tax=Phocaeicola sp. TaxID=2773926 RepID=UPI003AB0C4B1
MSKKRIICFHLFNDYSGSPKVLNMVLKGLLCKGESIKLVTSRGGVLDELSAYSNLKRYAYSYRFSTNPVVTMLRYGLVQLYTFFFAFRYIFRKNTVFYINTLLPIGPALAGRLMGKRVVYHYHENAFAKGAFYKALAWGMQKLAHEIICVSAYQASFLKRKKGVSVVPNALPTEFVSRLHPDAEAAFERKTVLMLSSLKEYKGTREFIELANRLPQYKFVLVINDTQENIDKYLSDNNLTNIRGGNLTIYPKQADVTSFYNAASVVVSLTNPKLVVETFGLTPLEAMSAGLPVIVPTQGGIAEMVKDGNNGYKIDVQELDAVGKHICVLLDNKELYIRMANNALLFSAGFDSEKVVTKLTQIITD